MAMERDCELEIKFAVLEERMNTHEARIDSTLNALRADHNAMRTDIERGQKVQIQWTIGAVVAAVIIIIGAVGLLTQAS